MVTNASNPPPAKAKKPAQKPATKPAKDAGKK